MKRNTKTRTDMQFVYDLTDKEAEKFYRGSGKATIVVDVANNIIACLYDTEYMHPRPGEEKTLLEAMAQPGTRWMEGIMSCYQFCTTDEGRIS
jgi:hypothetical protein